MAGPQRCPRVPGRCHLGFRALSLGGGGGGPGDDLVHIPHCTEDPGPETEVLPGVTVGTH